MPNRYLGLSDPFLERAKISAVPGTDSDLRYSRLQLEAFGR
jgi:hypothetical protein